MQRNEMIDRLVSTNEWDICVIGGGATGLGIAVDAASRGYATILLEQYDFAKGTSSRSTKLVHGGVRYLQQGNFKLVLEALNERGWMLRNAPHLVKNQSFVIPNYEWWEYPLYGIGLKAYDWMAGSMGLGPSEFLSVEETLKAIPTLDPEGLRGGVRYHDGQFDDARMAIHLAMTAADLQAVMLNYFPVKGLLKAEGKVHGVMARDEIHSVEYEIKSKAVINATGVFSDEVLRMDDPNSESLVSPSQGIHLSLKREFLPSDTAIMIPRTEDGRVLFAVPWHNRIIVGTTDTPVKEARIEPYPMEGEIEFVLHHIRDYLTQEPQMEDIRSVFCGLRPLIKGNNQNTAAISREHLITVSDSELITITGGKWTTYRKMAEDTVEVAIRKANLPYFKTQTQETKIHGYQEETDFNSAMYYYGSDLPQVEEIIKTNPAWSEKIHPEMPYVKAEILWAVREEMCMTIEDFLARRSRMLFLDAAISLQAAPTVAAIMGTELNQDDQWVQQQLETFKLIAKHYLPVSKSSDL